MSKLTLFFENNGVTETEFRQLKFDAANNALAIGVTQKAASDKIRLAMFAALEIEPTQNRKLLKRAMKKHRQDVFEIIEDVVEDKLVSGWKDSEWFQQFVEMKSLSLGDANEFYSKKPVYLTVSKVSGNHHDITVQRLGEGDIFSVKTNTYKAAVGTDIELFLMGRRDWNELINAVYSAFDTLIKNTMYAEVINVGSKLPANSQFNKSMELSATTKDTFDELLSDVSTANDDASVVIMGTRTAISKLEKLTDIEWVSENMKDEKNKSGRIGWYEGHALIEIPQRFAPGDTTTKLVDPNKLLVMPNDMDKFVKFVDVGDGEVNEITEAGETRGDAMIFEYQRTMGISTLVGKYFGVWNITA